MGKGQNRPPNSGQFKKNSTPWNKDIKGIHLSPTSEFKKGQPPHNKGIRTTGSPWRKEARRIYIASGKPMVCVDCGTDKKIDIDHYDNNYTNQNLNNLHPRCKSCHQKKSWRKGEKTMEKVRKGRWRY